MSADSRSDKSEPARRSPTTRTEITVAVVAGILLIASNIGQEVVSNRADLDLSRREFESDLILRSLEPRTNRERRESLRFMLDAGLLADAATRTRLEEFLNENTSVPRISSNLQLPEQQVELFELEPAEASGGISRGVDILAGTASPHSVTYDLASTSGEVWEEYRFPSEPYEKFSARVGISDNSLTPAPATISVSADGNRVFSEQVEVGEVVDVNVDVTGVSRLRLSATSTGSLASIVWQAGTLVKQ